MGRKLHHCLQGVLQATIVETSLYGQIICNDVN